MGLAGRKTKQRIPNDPRNLAWANDASKFGAAYLAKLGWDPSRGLGVSGEGRTTALSVNQKLDMLGIGADHKNSAEGLAWKQNKDFENLLRRLNAANGNADAEEEEAPMKIDGFIRAGPSLQTKDGENTQFDGEKGEDAVVEGEVGEGEKKSKKKRKKGTDEDGGEDRKRKRKKSKSSDDHSDSDKVSKKKKKKSKQESQEVVVSSPPEPEPVPSPTPVVAPLAKHPRAAYRGRHMAAKSLASKSSSAIAEILGISPATSAPVSGYPSSAPTPYPSTPFEPGPSTSSSSDPSGSATPAEELKLQDLTVSSMSVMDYFKEKLAAKSNSRVFGASSSPAAEDKEEERPRMGLGASRSKTQVARVTEMKTEFVEERRGLGGIGSGMRSSFAAMFASATVASTSTEQPAPFEEIQTVTTTTSKKDKERKKDKESKKDKGKEKEKATDDNVDADAVEDSDEKAERKRRKEEKRRRKEASAVVQVSGEGGTGTDAEVRERKSKKEKKKGKMDG